MSSASNRADVAPAEVQAASSTDLATGSLLFLNMMVSAFAGTGLGVLAPLMMPDLDITSSQFGLVVSAYFIGAMAFSHPAGRVAQRWGVRRSLVFFLLVQALTLSLIGWKGDETWFLIACWASTASPPRASTPPRDQQWISLVGRENWVVFTRDDRIRYRRVERDAFIAARLRVFCLTTAKLRGEEQTARFVNNINRILERARKPGPYIYGVYDRRLERIWPDRVSH